MSKCTYFKRPFLVLSGDHVSVATNGPKPAEFDIAAASIVLGYEKLAPKKYRLIGPTWKTVPTWCWLKFRSLIGV